MSITWSDQQQKVIDARNHTLLVSAAAGSGKTAVLVERIIQQVIQDKRNIDEILVVTFTNAAAAEMRERVLKAIEAQLKENPADLHLQLQTTLIHNAQITTIDSFCLQVLRNNFYQIEGLEPSFRIADTGELELLKQDICKQIMEKQYQSEDAHFFAFAESYGNVRSDQPIYDMILQLYQYSQSKPWPMKWLDAIESDYQIKTIKEMCNTKWAKSLGTYFRCAIDAFLKKNQLACAIIKSEGGPYPYQEAILADRDFLENVSHADTLEELSEHIVSYNPVKLGSCRSKEIDVEKKERVQEIRNQLKDQIKKWKEQFFFIPLEEQIELITESREIMHVLVTLTKDFSKEFEAAKKRQNIVDFSDVEHYALQILVEEETLRPTKAAQEYQEQFQEIMIDEYQDSNDVQETLLRAVSRVAAEGELRRENIFMVGDVKQSIYRFRLARPELFIEKYQSFGGTGSQRERINLDRNFRSRQEIVDITNTVFEKIMQADLGNVSYDNRAFLVRGAEDSKDPEGDYKPELYFLNSERESSIPKAEFEARMIAGRVQTMIEKQEIGDLRYSDIVILLRSLTDAPVYQKVFDEVGIPLVVTSKTGYFAAYEVQLILDFLKLIDNRKQDFALTSVMKSYFGKFTSEELAVIRAEEPGSFFYEAVEQYGQRDEKTRKFLEFLDSYRKLVNYTPIHLLIETIYKETGIYYYMSALPGGEQRKANLDMLLEKAMAYEATSYHGLYNFNRYIQQLQEYEIDFAEAETTSEQDSAVRLMTIHKSKGLEFSVVFVSGLGKNFNTTDQKSKLICHPEFGVGLKYRDRQRHFESDTIMRRAIALETRKENLGEELRVLYVALTRAKKKLFLVGSGKIDKIEPLYEEKMDFYQKLNAVSYLSWLVPVFKSMKQYSILDYSEEDLISDSVNRMESVLKKRVVLDEMLSDPLTDDRKINEILSFQYPFPLSDRKQKLSVSEIKHFYQKKREELAEMTSAESVFSQETSLASYTPRFISDQTPESAAQYGTAMHRFLECLDYQKIPDTDIRVFVEQSIESLFEKGKINQEIRQRLHPEILAEFLESETARTMRKAAKEGKLIREQPFVMALDSREIWQETPNETVLTQGIIDVFWFDEEGITILDYKTDHIQTVEELENRYKIQMKLYCQAVSRCFPDIPIKEAILYSLSLNEKISLAMEEMA